MIHKEAKIKHATPFRIEEEGKKEEGKKGNPLGGPQQNG